VCVCLRACAPRAVFWSERTVVAVLTYGHIAHVADVFVVFVVRLLLLLSSSSSLLQVALDPAGNTIRAVASKSDLFKELVNTWTFAPGPPHASTGSTQSSTYVHVTVRVRPVILNVLLCFTQCLPRPRHGPCEPSSMLCSTLLCSLSSTPMSRCVMGTCAPSSTLCSTLLTQSPSRSCRGI
jgi:hypothetical protein